MGKPVANINIDADSILVISGALVAIVFFVMVVIGGISKDKKAVEERRVELEHQRLMIEAGHATIEDFKDK